MKTKISAGQKPIFGSAVFALCAGLFVTAVAPAARADLWNKKTTMTFSGPIEVPGKALPAGTYVFKLLDSITSSRDVVQVYDKDQKHLLGTFLGIEDYRVKTPEKTIVNFAERPAGSPEAIQSWFYPGDNFGIQFVYPHKRALELARETHQNVLSMRDEMEKDLTAPASSPKDASVQELERTDVIGVTPSGNAVDVTTIVVGHPKK